MKLSDLPGLESLLYETVCKLNLTDQPWVLGGSCSLLLQGVQLDKPPRDIDIYTDAESVHELHASLADWAEDAPHLDQEGMYASILSHYGRYGVSIELVGGFTVMTGGSEYRVEIGPLLHHAAPEHRIQGTVVRLMPLSHELVFNVLRARPDRYEATAAAILLNPNEHLPLLSKILTRNRLNMQHRSTLSGLLDHLI
ncbi:hypothetical protein [Paenibacillus sp. FSL M8-0142]|uniref:hypothetical protein n=1 Tax=Paenibacillus sp. FSL M8-0142 TaxID=2954525 RepID=UPI00315B1EE6